MNTYITSEQVAVIAKVMEYEAFISKNFPRIEKDARKSARKEFKQGDSKHRTQGYAEIKAAETAKQNAKSKFFASEDDYLKAIDLYEKIHSAALAEIFSVVKQMFSAIGKNGVGIIVNDDGGTILFEAYKMKSNRFLPNAPPILDGEPIMSNRLDIKVYSWAKFYEIFNEEIDMNTPGNEELRIFFIEDVVATKNGKKNTKLFLRDV